MKSLSAVVRIPVFVTSLLALLLGLPSPASAQEQLVYEREFSLMGSDDNTLRIVVTEDGEVTINRPEFMTFPGEHRGSVPRAAAAELRSALESIDFTGRALYEDLRQRSRNELFVVSDPEYSRFGLFDCSRAPLKVIEAESLRAYAQRFRDQRIERLRNLELRFLELMDQVVEGGAS